jgi:hypothetical protein
MGIQSTMVSYASVEHEARVFLDRVSRYHYGLPFEDLCRHRKNNIFSLAVTTLQEEARR